MTNIKTGSKWMGADRKMFTVIDVVDIEGNTWVHYREDLGIKVPTKECKEFSCYAESFVHRFTEFVN